MRRTFLGDGRQLACAHTREINDNLQGRVAVRSRAGHEIPARWGTHPYQRLSHCGVEMFRLEGGQQPFCIPAL